MNKFLPCFILSTVALVLAITLSFIFAFPLSNSWQAGIALFFVFGPYWIYAWRKARSCKDKHPFLCGLARFYLILMLVGYLITVLSFLMVGQ